jgi:DNA polymerase-3 subunit gamma/tau
MLVRRESRTGANELHTIFRPCTVSEMLGNKTNVNMIKKGLDNNTLSHTFLFTGDAGCGKTTMARLIALSLNCEQSDEPTSTPCLKCNSCKSILNHNSVDVIEINVGRSGGKDAVDNVVKDLPSSPFSAKHKVIIFDEAHKLTTAAQDLLLKVIEDGFSYVYFIFATNHPEKLSDAFMTRCNVMHFGRISKDLIAGLLKNVAEFEAMEYKVEVLDYIAEESRGVPRNALVWLKQRSKSY